MHHFLYLNDLGELIVWLLNDLKVLELQTMLG